MKLTLSLLLLTIFLFSFSSAEQRSIDDPSQQEIQLHKFYFVASNFTHQYPLEVDEFYNIKLWPANHEIALCITNSTEEFKACADLNQPKKAVWVLLYNPDLDISQSNYYRPQINLTESPGAVLFEKPLKGKLPGAPSFNYSLDSFPMGYISQFELAFLDSLAKESNNSTGALYGRFDIVSIYNCRNFIGFVTFDSLYSVLYSVLALALLIALNIFYRNVTSFMVRILPFLPLTRFVICSLSSTYFSLCPWDQENYREQLIAIKVTLSTLYQTFFSAYLIALNMGLTVTRQSLNREQIKTLSTVIGIQYLVNSVYSLSSQFTYFSSVTGFIVTAYSLGMILVISKL